ncbi:MAG: AAA family ATPase [Eubacteriales bacterium]
MSDLNIIRMDEIEAKDVEWLWYPYIPYGKITIVQGDPGEGKTTTILRISAMLSRGEKLPCDDTEREPINIIYQTAEDGLDDTVKPRLIDANADCSRIKVIDETNKSLTMIDERIEQALIETGARVVILDPIQAYLGKDVNMNSANEIRDVTKQIGHLANRLNCAIILIGHMNKGGGKSAYRGLGTIDFQAVARSVLIVGRVKDNPTMRVIAQSKSSLAAEGDSIAFELGKENGFQWLGKCDMSVDDLLMGVSKENKSQLAHTLLTEFLADGRKPQSEIIAKAKEKSISKRVLDEAKKKLNVKSIKAGNQWHWELEQ